MSQTSNRFFKINELQHFSDDAAKKTIFYETRHAMSLYNFINICAITIFVFLQKIGRFRLPLDYPNMNLTKIYKKPQHVYTYALRSLAY